MQGEGPLPVLEIPKGETVQFNLTSQDVIHAFWVPEFLFKRDVIPGHPNHFAITATKTGTFTGHCSELCGLYHAKMLFTLKVVTPQQFQAVHGARSRPRRIHPGARSEHDRTARPASSQTPQDRAQGEHPRVLAVLDRPQDHRAPVPDHLVLLLPVRRGDGADHADPAARPGPARRLRPAVQRAVHHARHDHAAAVRHPAVRRVRERAAAAADRRARRGVPAAQPAELLHVHLRRADPAGQLPVPGRRRRRSAGTRTPR